jgi:RNA polymerase sigma factor (sigma-70 family)
MKASVRTTTAEPCLDDEYLVRRCVAGSESAWSALVGKYKNLIFSLPIRFGFSREDANEIFQEVCLILLNELPSVRNPRTLAAWLIRVTTRECFHWRRRNPTFTVDGREIVVPPEPDEDLKEQLQREQALREAVAEMSGRCRRLIEMLFFAQPTAPYQEVARDLGIAVGSVGFIRQRCLNRLRRALVERGFR